MFPISKLIKCQNVSQAARYGQLEKMKRLISLGKPVDAADNRGWRPTHEAVAGNHTECLEELLKHEKSDVDYQSFDGITALMEAARGGHLVCLNILLSKGADPNRMNHMEVTPLMAAVINDHLDCVTALIACGADINCQQYSGMTALHLSVEKNKPLIVHTLLNSAVMIDRRNEHGLTALFLAAQYGNFECLSVILEHTIQSGEMALVNICADDGASPVYLASQEGHLDCVRLLLDHGADVNLITHSPRALPLHAAVEFNHLECVKLLLPKTDRNILSSCDNSIYYFSMLHDDDNITQCLIAAGVDFTRCSIDSEYSPLIFEYFTHEVIFRSQSVNALTLLALNRCCLIHASALISGGIELKTIDLPQLLVALDKCNLPLVRLLVEHGANVNIYHPKVVGNLSVIVSLLNWKCLNYILRCGADVMSIFRSSSSVEHNSHEIDDESESEPGILRTPIPFWRLFAESRILMRNSGITAGQLLYRILQFTGNVTIDPLIYCYLDSEEDKREIYRLTSEPHRLMHLCRLKIRSSFRPNQLMAENSIIESLPLPTMIIDYVDYKELS